MFRLCRDPFSSSLYSSVRGHLYLFANGSINARQLLALCEVREKALAGVHGFSSFNLEVKSVECHLHALMCSVSVVTVVFIHTMEDDQRLNTLLHEDDTN